MAARPRHTKNKDLPANLYRVDQHGYRYRHPIKGTWHGMGTDKIKAVAAARKLNSMLIVAPDDLVSAVLGTNKTFSEFSTYYMEEVLPQRNLAKSTLTLYRCRIGQFNSAWGETHVDKITLKMVDVFFDSLPTRSSNQARSLLIDIFNHAVSKGLCPDNQAAMTLPKVEKKHRKRLTLDGLKAIRAVAEPWLQNAIDLALLTAQRRSDIIKLKWEDIRDGWIYIAQEKTTEDSDDEFEELTGAGYIRIKIDSEIQSVLSRCRESNIISPYVIHRKPSRIDHRQRGFKEHWTAIEPHYLSTSFRLARKKANPYPNWSANQQPGFHEIRALSIHLYKQMGRDPQALAGHTNPEMTKHYASGHSTIIWNDVEVGLKLPFD